MMQVNQVRAAIRAQHIMPDISLRALARSVSGSHQSMSRLTERCVAKEIDHHLAQTLTDNELMQKLYPSLNGYQTKKRMSDVEEAILELTKKRGKRKTQTVLYLGYRAKDPETALSRAQYCRYINKALKRTKVVMRQFHAAGDVVYIDYAGTKVFYLKNDKKVWVKVFVAVLGASKKIFAWATYGEKTEHWIDGMVRMFNFYGGVTHTVSIDNAKALVTKPGLIPILNANIKAFGEHYGILFDSCRVGTGSDKALVELGVKFITQHILVPMLNDHTFFDIESLNVHLSREVAKLNALNFQGLNISRNDLFNQNESDALKPLPSKPYKMLVYQQKHLVPIDYHIRYLKHGYSVPFNLRGEQVDVVVDHSELHVIHNGATIVSHKVVNEPGAFTTLEEHMPAEHLADAKNNDGEQNQAWANGIGTSVSKIVKGWYGNSRNAKSRRLGKQCQQLKIIHEDIGSEALERACEYAINHRMTTIDGIQIIISASKHENGVENLPHYTPSHANVRGSDYYGDDDEA